MVALEECCGGGYTIDDCPISFRAGNFFLQDYKYPHCLIGVAMKSQLTRTYHRRLPWSIAAFSAALLLVITLSFACSTNAFAAVCDSNTQTLDVLIAPKSIIDIGQSFNDPINKPSNRIVFSTKLGTQGDYFGPSVFDTAALKKYNAKSISFVIDSQGRAGLEKLGYKITGEIPTLTDITTANFPQVPGPVVSGTSCKPGQVDFTGVLSYGQGGKMLLPMTIKVLPKFFITKNLVVDKNIEIPATTSVFSLTPSNTTPNAPLLDNITISYNKNERGIKTSADVADCIADKFSKAGEYTYLLKETTAPQNIQDVTCSSSAAEYEVTFVVEHNPHNTKPNAAGKISNFRVLAVKVKQLKDDAGKDVTSNNLDNYYKSGKDNSIRFTEIVSTRINSDPNVHVLYRLYNPYTHEHFFTAETTENDNLVRLGWKSEGGVGYIYKHAEKGGVYRLYNPSTGEHHYTTDENELAKCVKAGWKNEGVKWFSAQDKDKMLNKLYSMYNPYEKKFYHHYTADAKEIEQMVKAGWRKEEVKWCTLPLTYNAK